MCGQLVTFVKGLYFTLRSCRWSGCGSVMVPLQPAQRMFGGAAAASPAHEPRLVMRPIQARWSLSLLYGGVVEERRSACLDQVLLQTGAQHAWFWSAAGW